MLQITPQQWNELGPSGKKDFQETIGKNYEDGYPSVDEIEKFLDIRNNENDFILEELQDFKKEGEIHMNIDAMWKKVKAILKNY